MAALTRLLSNEIRIEWRELTTQRGSAMTWILGAGILLLMLAVWFWLLQAIRPLLVPQIDQGAIMLAGILLLALIPFGITMGINQSVKAIFERNDLDLLISSPTPGSAVFASRLLSVAAYIFVILGIFLIPLGLVGLFTGVPRLLGVVPVLVVIALISAALGMLITLLLVRIFGARPARTISQILAATAGVVLILAIQIPALVGGSQNQLPQLNRIMEMLQPGGLLGPASLIWFPGRTLFLAPVPTLVSLAFAGALFVITVAVLHRWFILGASQSHSTVRKRRTDSGRGLQFNRRAALWRIMLMKDWRSLVRDPYLISQSLLQLAYLLPLALILFLDGSLLEQFQAAPVVATALTVLAGTLSSNFARICMSGEEASDLLIASPVAPVTLQRSKLLAAVIPVWAVFLPFAVALTVLDVGAALTAIVMILVTTTAVAFTRLQNPLRVSRQDLFNRKNQSDPWLFLETLIPLASALTTWFVLTGNTNAWIPAVAGVAMVAFGWWRGKVLGPGIGEPSTD